MSYPTPLELHAAMRRLNVDELVIQAGDSLTYHLYCAGSDEPVHSSESWIGVLRWLGLYNPEPRSSIPNAS